MIYGDFGGFHWGMSLANYLDIYLQLCISWTRVWLHCPQDLSPWSWWLVFISERLDWRGQQGMSPAPKKATGLLDLGWNLSWLFSSRSLLCNNVQTTDIVCWLNKVFCESFASEEKLVCLFVMLIHCPQKGWEARLGHEPAFESPSLDGTCFVTWPSQSLFFLSSKRSTLVQFLVFLVVVVVASLSFGQKIPETG